MFKGLDPIGESTFIDVGVTIGTGRKMEASLSLVIPGGATRFPENGDEEGTGGIVEAACVATCGGSDNLLAY